MRRRIRVHAAWLLPGIAALLTAFGAGTAPCLARGGQAARGPQEDVAGREGAASKPPSARSVPATAIPSAGPAADLAGARREANDLASLFYSLGQRLKAVQDTQREVGQLQQRVMAIEAWAKGGVRCLEVWRGLTVAIPEGSPVRAKGLSMKEGEADLLLTGRTQADLTGFVRRLPDAYPGAVPRIGRMSLSTPQTINAEVKISLPPSSAADRDGNRPWAAEGALADRIDRLRPSVDALRERRDGIQSDLRQLEERHAARAGGEANLPAEDAARLRRLFGDLAALKDSAAKAAGELDPVEKGLADLRAGWTRRLGVGPHVGPSAEGQPEGVHRSR